MDFSTMAIHEGQAPDAATGATVVPVYQTSVYSGPISTTNSGSNGASIPDETEPLFLN
jgi:O-acetylhomoserine/O-acetylserine sulfhydrylase-like pyridoxal-dependent enzyme